MTRLDGVCFFDGCNASGYIKHPPIIFCCCVLHLDPLTRLVDLLSVVFANLYAVIALAVIFCLSAWHLAVILGLINNTQPIKKVSSIIFFFRAKNPLRFLGCWCRRIVARLCQQCFDTFHFSAPVSFLHVIPQIVCAAF